MASRPTRSIRCEVSRPWTIRPACWGDLAAYLDVLDGTPNLAPAFKDYWSGKGVRVGGEGEHACMEPYQNNVPGVPHICAKEPTEMLTCYGV